MNTRAGFDRLRNLTLRWEGVLHRVALAGIAISVIGMMWAMPMKELAAQLRVWSQEEHGLGGAIFVGCYLLFTVLSLPVWPMPVIAGAAFGKLWGTALASASCVLGATVTFYIARALRLTALRKHLESSPRMRALETTVEAGNWKIVAAVRLSHMLPFGMQNYGFGLTKINVWTFCITTWLITLPGTFLQAWLGDLGFESIDAWQSRDSDNWTPVVFQVGGILLLAAALTYIAWLGKSVYWNEAQRQLDRQLEREQRRSGGAVWPVATLLLTGVMLIFAVVAVWSVIEVEAIREYVSNVSLETPPRETSQP